MRDESDPFRVDASSLLTLRSLLSSTLNMGRSLFSRNNHHSVNVRL